MTYDTVQDRQGVYQSIKTESNQSEWLSTLKIIKAWGNRQEVRNSR